MSDVNIRALFALILLIACSTSERVSRSSPNFSSIQRVHGNQTDKFLHKRRGNFTHLTEKITKFQCNGNANCEFLKKRERRQGLNLKRKRQNGQQVQRNNTHNSIGRPIRKQGTWKNQNKVPTQGTGLENPNSSNRNYRNKKKINIRQGPWRNQTTHKYPSLQYKKGFMKPYRNGTIVPPSDGITVQNSPAPLEKISSPTPSVFPNNGQSNNKSTTAETLETSPAFSNGLTDDEHTHFPSDDESSASLSTFNSVFSALLVLMVWVN